MARPEARICAKRRGGPGPGAALRVRVFRRVPAAAGTTRKRPTRVRRLVDDQLEGEGFMRMKRPVSVLQAGALGVSAVVGVLAWGDPAGAAAGVGSPVLPRWPRS
jgi:hypothetical protein